MGYLRSPKLLFIIVTLQKMHNFTKKMEWLLI